MQSSLTLMPVVVSSIILSWATGLCTTIFGRYKWSLLIGFAMQLIGVTLIYSMFKPGLSSGVAIGVMLITGIGFGCQMQSSLVACQSATHQKEVAMATAVRNFFVSKRRALFTFNRRASRSAILVGL